MNGSVVRHRSCTLHYRLNLHKLKIYGLPGSGKYNVVALKVHLLYECVSGMHGNRESS
jgi:hypothetical protein